jgi:plastocyanin
VTIRWRSVALGAATMASLLQIGVGDREAIGLGLALALAAQVLFWKGWLLARLAVAGLCVNLIVWMAPAAASNLSHRDDLQAVVRPVALVALAVLTLVALMADARGAAAPSRGAAQAVVATALAVPLIVGGARVLGVGEDVVRQPGDFDVTMRDTEFHPADLTVDAGTVGVVVSNDDLFWHTLSIDELGVDLRVPTGGTRRIELTGVAPGTYEIVCIIPGHESLGMTGELTVR